MSVSRSLVEATKSIKGGTERIPRRVGPVSTRAKAAHSLDVATGNHEARLAYDGDVGFSPLRFLVDAERFSRCFRHGGHRPGGDFRARCWRIRCAILTRR